MSFHGADEGLGVAGVFSAPCDLGQAKKCLAAVSKKRFGGDTIFVEWRSIHGWGQITEERTISTRRMTTRAHSEWLASVYEKIKGNMEVKP